LLLVETIVKPVVAEFVEASKRPQEKTNEVGGFDKFRHWRILIIEN